jgi:hypothetical protein
MSHKEVSNARHYREHTREQDGWTVLALPPATGSDLPPPYTPEAAPVVPAPSAAPALDTAGTMILCFLFSVIVADNRKGPPLAFDVPINSNIVGVAPASRTTSFTRGASFAIAFLDICKMMGLDPSMARIGYKWDNEASPNKPTHVLGNATDWENCLASGFFQQKRARTRTVICMIKNMVRLPPLMLYQF